MSKNASQIDLPKFYARFAELKNASQVAREFELTRFKVNKLWGDLGENERLKYENDIADKKQAALEKYKDKVADETQNYAERLHKVKLTLLAKLEASVSALKEQDPYSIARIKDASAALKNLSSFEQDDGETGDDILKKFTHIQKLQS